MGMSYSIQSALIDRLHTFSTPTAPISGVEEVDATILSYLPIGSLQYIALDQQKSPTQSHHLLADDSRLWSLLLERTLGVRIVHGRGIPYRTLFVAVTAHPPQARPYDKVEDYTQYQGWTVRISHAIKSIVTVTGHAMGRETLGLLVAILDHIIVEHTSHIRGPFAPDVVRIAFREAMDDLCSAGCVAGWEAITSRCLGLPLPEGFPMTQYGYNNESIVSLSTLSEIGPIPILLNICELMKYPHVTAEELERLTRTYLWHWLADRVDKHWTNGDGRTIVMDALQRGAREGRSPATLLLDAVPPGGSIHPRAIHPKFILNVPIRGSHWANAAATPAKLRFFLTYLVPLTRMDSITTNNDDIMRTLLLSAARPVDDYTTLDAIHGGLNVFSILDGRGLAESPGDTISPKVLLAPTMEPTLIKTFVTRIRTREQADRFMTYVAQNSIDPTRPSLTQDRRSPYCKMLSKASQNRYLTLPGDLIVDRHTFPYPYLMAAYDAFCGHLDQGTLDVLTLGTRIVNGQVIIPNERDEMVVYVTEALVRGRKINGSIESDPNYDTLCSLVEAVQATMRPIGTLAHYRDHQSPSNGTMHGTPYGIIAASMYDDALFANMVERLAPREANDHTRLDLLVRACAVQYAEVMRNNGISAVSGSNLTTTSTNPLEGQLETLIHERCMMAIEEYYHKITPTLEVWDDRRREEREDLARTRLIRLPGSHGKYNYYPGYSLWQSVCRPADPLVSSVLLSMAECRLSSRYNLYDVTSDAQGMFWMDYGTVLGLPNPRDYTELVNLGSVLPTLADLDLDSPVDASKYTGPTYEQYMDWLRDLLPLMWEANKYDTLAGALASVGWEVS